MNKNVVIAILTTFVVTVLVIGIIGVATEDDPEPTYTPQQTQSQSDQEDVVADDQDLESAMKDGFMQGCSPEGNNDPYCSCAYDKLADNYSAREMQMFGDMDQSEYPQKFYEIMATCADKYEVIMPKETEIQLR